MDGNLYDYIGVLYPIPLTSEILEKIGMSVFTEEGHDYLVVDTKHGVCVVHAQSCPCRKKK